jgi:cytochrome c6
LKRLFAVLALVFATALIGFAPASQAADLANGAKVFSANCAACHIGGGNVVMAQKTLKKAALAQFLVGYADDPVKAVVSQIANGKGAMPSWSPKLTVAQIDDVAAYVLDQAEKGW